MLANHLVLAIYALLHSSCCSCCNLQCCGFLLLPSIMIYTKPPLKWILHGFDASRIRPRLGGLPHLERLHGKILPRLRGSPHLSCKRDQIKKRRCLDRRVTPPTWGPPPPCKQALCAWDLFCMRIKIIFISMVLHLASLWNKGLRQLGNGLIKNWSAYIYISYLGGNLVYKHKTIKFYLWENNPLKLMKISALSRLKE